jgi:hypothetical protein
MSYHFSQKNLLSSSLLVLFLFLLSPEGKAMDDNTHEDTIELKKVWKLLLIEWDNSPNRERFPKKAIVKEENGKTTLTTDCSGTHLYQLESQNLKDVNPEDTLKFSYKIQGNAKGINLILRDKTHQRPIPEAIFPLQDGSNIKQDLQFVVPKGAKDISVLLYNEAIIPSATFTINELKIEKVEERSPPIQQTQQKKEEIKIGGRTANEILHNIVTETNKGTEKVKDIGIGVENIVRNTKNEFKKIFKKNKKKKEKK